jgi:hypothetical protein
MPGRSRGNNIVWHKYNYKTKKSGIGKMSLKAKPSLYVYSKRVSTIYPEKDNLKIVNQTFVDNFNAKKDFESEEVLFEYTPDNIIKQLPKPADTSILNNYNTQVLVCLDQLLISPKYRSAYINLIDKVGIMDVELTTEQQDSIWNKITENKEIKLLDYLSQEQLDVRQNKLVSAIEELISTVDRDEIGELATIVDLRNKYDVMDNLENTELKGFTPSDKILKTRYLIKTSYWKNFEYNLANYDPVEVLLLYTLAKQGRIMLELNVPLGDKFSINVNEVQLFTTTVMKDNISKPQITHLSIANEYINQPLYTLVY